jgi:hypothetical protein
VTKQVDSRRTVLTRLNDLIVPKGGMAMSQPKGISTSTRKALVATSAHSRSHDTRLVVTRLCG